MIRVVGCHRRDVFTLSMLGHAGYAEKGDDIVCAGASVLVHSLAATLRLLEVPELRVDLKDGQANISCRIDSATVHVLFYQALVGLILMQQEYPAHIRVVTAGFFEGDVFDKEEEIA